MWLAAAKRKVVATVVFIGDGERLAVTSGLLDQLFRHVVMMNIDGVVLHCLRLLVQACHFGRDLQLVVFKYAALPG